MAWELGGGRGVFGVDRKAEGWQPLSKRCFPLARSGNARRRHEPPHLRPSPVQAVHAVHGTRFPCTACTACTGGRMSVSRGGTVRHGFPVLPVPTVPGGAGCALPGGPGPPR